MNLRNRILEMRTVEPAEIAPNPKNWRKHPKKQREAIRGIFAEIGIAGCVIAYKSQRTGKLTLIDGHERMSTGVALPALILDVTDEEADKLLAVYDPIGALGEMDPTMLAELLTTVTGTTKGVQELLGVMAESVSLPEMVGIPRPEDTTFYPDSLEEELETGIVRKCPNCGFVSKELGTVKGRSKQAHAVIPKDPVAAATKRAKKPVK